MISRRSIRNLCTGLLLAATVATLPGCGLLLLGGAAGGVLVATDRRSLGAQTEDREIQVKAISDLNSNLPDVAHVNVTSFNRRVLLTGEVPDQATRQEAENIVKGIQNVRGVVNALAISGASSLSSRANDAWITSKVKASLVAAKDISANVFKVVTERSDVYLMGLVTPAEGARGADIASRVPGVDKVVKVFEYIQPEDAQRLTEQAAKTPQPAEPADDTATTSAVPIGNVSTTPLSTPAPIGDAPVIPATPASQSGAPK